MQPFVNPNYYQTIMPMGINQAQPSKFVNRFDEIMASDVPMDGKWVLFGKNDMSEVCAKAWSPQGTISTIVFKNENSPIQTPKITQTDILPQNENKAENEPILAQIKALEDKVTLIISKIDSMNAKNGGKKNESNANA